jgi:DNA end-binding protein Ku
MLSEKKVAIAKTVMGNKETLLAILPTEDGILIETMFYQDEIRELAKVPSKPPVTEAELNMAKLLINSMDKAFEPELYHDEYQERLRGVIEQKIAGKEIVAAAPEEKTNVIDLMEALKASLEQQKVKPTPKRKRASGAR